MKPEPIPRLSICLIVKDEEEMLPDCLKSLEGLDAEILITDTGSTDKTVEIARQFGASIQHYEWCNDFSKARNASITHARADWIFWLDADERLTAESRATLESLLVPAPKPTIYLVRIKNLKEDGINYSLSDAHRLFSNHHNIHFTGSVHEQISPSARDVGAEELQSNITLDHLGYSFTDNRRDQKQLRNRTLLLKEVKRNPGNAYAHFTLGHNFKLDNKAEKALHHYKQALKLDQFDQEMKASLQNNIADIELDMGQFQSAGRHITASLKVTEMQVAGHYLRYRLANSNDEHEAALSALDDLTRVSSHIQLNGTGISTDIEISEHLIAFTRGELLLKLGRLAEAESAFERTAELDGDSMPVLSSLFKIQEQGGKWEEALSVLQRMLRLSPKDLNLLNAQGALQLKLGQPGAAIEAYKLMLQINNDLPEIKQKIASIFAKLGDIQQAESWLGKI